MSTEVAPLTDYSQHGEQAIILNLLAKLPERNRWCVDVGAGDGVRYSNIKYLLDVCGYWAITFDPGYDAPQRSDVFHARTYVGFEGGNTLDQLLLLITRRLDFPFDFDFLSIDIDGNDYHVWNAVTAFRPKVVCIEFNPTIPSEVMFMQKADMGVNQGSSIGALVELGRQKGYALVDCSPFNAFFVKAEYFPLMGVANNSIRALRRDVSYVTWLFTGYDGTIFISGNERMSWHPIWFDARDFQLIPKRLRKYPDKYSRFERWLFDKWNWLRTHWPL